GPRKVCQHQFFSGYCGQCEPDNENCVVLQPGERVVSWDTRFQWAGPKAVRIDNASVVKLPKGAQVVSWQSGYTACDPGQYVDGVNCVILPENHVVAKKYGEVWQVLHSDDTDSRIDGVKVKILPMTDELQGMVSHKA